MTWIVQNLWLIPALPMLAAGISALAKQRNRMLAASLAIGSMVLSFLLSSAPLRSPLAQQSGTETRQVVNFRWFQFGSEWLKLGWMLDPLTAVMLVMVTFVGLLIFIYSIGYMDARREFHPLLLLPRRCSPARCSASSSPTACCCSSCAGRSSA